jgi:hypothetical protein
MAKVHYDALLDEEIAHRHDTADVTIAYSTSAPESPQSGQMYINLLDNKLYVYFSGSWQEVAQLTGVPSGSPFGLWLPFYRTYS